MNYCNGKMTFKNILLLGKVGGTIRGGNIETIQYATFMKITAPYKMLISDEINKKHTQTVGEACATARPSFLALG